MSKCECMQLISVFGDVVLYRKVYRGFNVCMKCVMADMISACVEM